MESSKVGKRRTRNSFLINCEPCEAAKGARRHYVGQRKKERNKRERERKESNGEKYRSWRAADIGDSVMAGGRYVLGDGGRAGQLQEFGEINREIS